MAIDDLLKKFELSKEYLEKFKNKEISEDEFYKSISLLLDWEIKEVDTLKAKDENLEEGIIYFKRNILDLQRRLLNLENMYEALFNQGEQVHKPHPFADSVREYDEEQKYLKKKASETLGRKTSENQ